MNEYYVYGWQDIDSGEMIYIGQGKGKRYSECDRTRRNSLFNNYLLNHEVYPFILINNLTEQESLEKEALLVKFYKNIEQCICNIAADGYRSMPGSSNPNYQNGDVLRKTYKEHPELKEKTKHCGIDNGMARPVMIIIGQKEIRFKYVTDAAQYLIDSGISKGSLANARSAIATRAMSGKSYCGCYFKYI